MKVAFLHPDLGLGGAERLVVDAAVSLQALQHEVILYTARHPQKSFEETRDGTLQVRVKGSCFPMHIAGKLTVCCAWIRSLLGALQVATVCWGSYDVLILDQIPIAIPLLRLLRPSLKIVFYCHFPDQLLTERTSLLKTIYRYPFDRLEEICTGLADRVLCNSKFTQQIVRETFPSVRSTEVLYPAINVENYDKAVVRNQLTAPILDIEAPLLLSINRFERKKNLALAVQALAQVLKTHKNHNAVLVLAGGCDPTLDENMRYFAALHSTAAQLGLSTSDFPDTSGQVIFLPRFTDEQRTALLSKCVCVVYTPDREHFGIVPVEAMQSGCPVIAVNTGGPCESIIDAAQRPDRCTGFLVANTAHAFAAAITQLLSDPQAARAMGQRGRTRVADCFSLSAFGQSLERTCKLPRRPHTYLLLLRLLLLASLIWGVWRLLGHCAS